MRVTHSKFGLTGGLCIHTLISLFKCYFSGIMQVDVSYIRDMAVYAGT